MLNSNISLATSLLLGAVSADQLISLSDLNPVEEAKVEDLPSLNLQGLDGLELHGDHVDHAPDEEDENGDASKTFQ